MHDTAGSPLPDGDGYSRQRLAPFAAMDGWLWHGWASSYLNYDRFESLHSQRPDHPFGFQPTLIAPLGKGRKVLVADIWGVWLLTVAGDGRWSP